MGVEIIGDTADGIHGIGQDVCNVITVKIKRVMPVAAGDKLTVPHRPRIGTRQRHRVEALFTGHQQILGKLAAKKTTPGRIVECQSGKGIEHPILSFVGAIPGFDADNRRND